MTQPTKRLTKSHIAVAQNASGRNLNVPIYHLSDGLPGPKVYIQSSIHGAEVQGNIVIYHLLQQLQTTRIYGDIILVPNCNPVGTNIKAGEYTLGRFDPVNGTNWNRGYFYDADKIQAFVDNLDTSLDKQEIKRNFKSQWKNYIEEKLNQPWGLGLAQQLNLTLQKIAVDADIVLDLHNGPVSTRHIYIPEYAKASANYFNIEHCIFIPNKFAGALDEATFCTWWTLTDLLKQKFGQSYNFDIEAFTLEMGSQEVIDFNEGETDAVSILSYLSSKGCIDSEAFTPKQMKRVGVYLEDYKTLYTDFGGMVEYCAKPGTRINKHEVMARVLNIDELDNANATHTVNAPCNLIPILHFPSASVLSGTQLYKCFTNYFEL